MKIPHNNSTIIFTLIDNPDVELEGTVLDYTDNPLESCVLVIVGKDEPYYLTEIKEWRYNNIITGSLTINIGNLKL